MQTKSLRLLNIYLFYEKKKRGGSSFFKYYNFRYVDNLVTTTTVLVWSQWFFVTFSILDFWLSCYVIGAAAFLFTYNNI